MSKMQQPLELLQTWLQRQLPGDAWDWLSDTANELSNDGTDRQLYLAVSLVSRKAGKSDLRLTGTDLSQADEARSGWRPEGWSVDQAARLMLMLIASPESAEFSRRLEQLCVTADVDELIAFYQGLPLYPEPSRYVARAGEGLRTNMKAVFEAVAHRNPYPQEHFSQSTWNQMVLKAIFIGSSLDPIQGLDDRRNEDLAQKLIDYVHERWAANRAVTPELWRMVGPFVNEDIIADLQRPLTSDLLVERQAAALALRECPNDLARGGVTSHLSDQTMECVAGILSDVVGRRASWEVVCENSPKP